MDLKIDLRMPVHYKSPHKNFMNYGKKSAEMVSFIFSGPKRKIRHIY